VPITYKEKSVVHALQWAIGLEWYLLVNDPWRGAIHCSDINILRPVRINGRAEFVLHSTSHVVDLGGPIPGGFANGVQTSFEEQLKFPPKLSTERKLRGRL